MNRRNMFSLLRSILFVFPLTAIIGWLIWLNRSTFEPTVQNLKTEVEALKTEAKLRDEQIERTRNKQQITSQAAKNQEELKNLQTDLSALNSQVQVLKAQIDTLGAQQQNFMGGAIWFFGIISAATVIRELVFSNQLKEDAKKEITASISKEINQIIWEETEAMKRQQKWLEYKTALLSAEQLKYASKDEVKLSKAAIYEHLRAIFILEEASYHRASYLSIPRKSLPMDRATHIYAYICIRYKQSGYNIAL